MERYVLGIDLGTSAVKVSCLDHSGKIIDQEKENYPVYNSAEGFSEQNPNDWVQGTLKAIKKIMIKIRNLAKIDGISFSGQMHSLVILDKNKEIIRPAILWNDGRTATEAKYINENFGKKIVEITGNKATAGFTLPKLLWLQKNEPNNFARIRYFMMPKDYVRYKMTGKINTDYSDATGTIMLDIAHDCWSNEILNFFKVPRYYCPELVNSTDFIGFPLHEVCGKTGLNQDAKIFAGGGDNAVAAIGSGILNSQNILCSIGTSGVILANEKSPHTPYEGTLQMEHHAIPDHFYSMGVTLAAGESLSWFKNTFFPQKSFHELLLMAQKSDLGANKLFFTPYINGERTPYSDSFIRGSFTGISNTSTRNDFCRAVIEGITYSLQDLISIYEQNNKTIYNIISIGGGAKSKFWLKLQADVFGKNIIALKNEQGPGIGAAMIAAMGCRWFKDWNSCINVFVKYNDIIVPDPHNTALYKKYYHLYHKIYNSIAPLGRAATRL